MTSLTSPHAHLEFWHRPLTFPVLMIDTQECSDPVLHRRRAPQARLDRIGSDGCFDVFGESDQDDVKR